jgi:murein DD-endopeptidase MepM/ murein hydrolase activator NlpD
MLHRRWTLVAAIAALLASAIGPGPTALGQDEPAPVYYLPAPAGTALIVSQGQGEAERRSDAEENAFDFMAASGPARFTVAAARGGTVIGVRSGIRGGRCRQLGEGGTPPNCWREVNLVLIDHGDGTSGLYLHLRPGRSPVSTGDIVSAEQPIGAAGNSGWTDEIGLQFQVQRTRRRNAGAVAGSHQSRPWPSPTRTSWPASGWCPQTGDTVTSDPGPIEAIRLGAVQSGCRPRFRQTARARPGRCVRRRLV